MSKHYKYNMHNVCLNPTQNILRMGSSSIIIESAYTNGKWINGYQFMLWSGVDNYTGGASPCVYSEKRPSFNSQKDAIIDGFNYFKKKFPELTKKIDKHLATIFKHQQLAFDF